MLECSQAISFETHARKHSMSRQLLISPRYNATIEPSLPAMEARQEIVACWRQNERLAKR